MLIEERFPQRALVGGDIDRGQAEQAQKMAALVLGRDLELPVCVDAPRLIDRLRRRYEGAALVSAFGRVFLDDPMERSEAMLRCFPGPDGARWWIQRDPRITLAQPGTHAFRGLRRIASDLTLGM